MTAQTVSRAELREVLAAKDAQTLSAVLVAADIAHDGPEEGAERLAERLVGALWWRTHSPARNVVLPQSLDAIVDRIERKLRLDLGTGDVWARLETLTSQLLDRAEPIGLEDLDAATRKRLRRVIFAQVFGVGAAGTAAGARFASLKLLQWASGPTWRLITMLPQVGPVLLGIRSGVGTVAAVSGPVGVVMALLTLNSVFGPTDDKALPLLLGVGLACRQPLQVVR